MKQITAYMFFLVAASSVMQAQHYQFSQFYSSPTYINPAFTGADVCSRITLNYRNQWSGIPGTFTTYQASFDHTLRRMNSGIGLQFLSDKAGLASLRTTQINVLYAYETRIKKKVVARAGLSVGSVQRKADYGTFVFGDQMARGSEASLEKLPSNGMTYMDIGAGVLVYTSEAWFGFSASHINKPNQSLMNGTSPLPAELKFHGGYKFVIDKGTSSNKKIPYVHTVTVAYNLKHQQKFNQLDLGLYYTKNWLVLGGWFRAIPFYKPEPGYENNDAIVFLIGFNAEKLKIGYSYDMTISKISNAQSNGSHELSISYQLCSVKKARSRKYVLISCPKF